MIRTVVVANTAEAFEQLLGKVLQTDKGARRIRHEMTLSQRAFFYGGDDKIVITPQRLPEELMSRNAALCKFLNVQNVCLAEPVVALSRAVMKDKSLIKFLVRTLSKTEPVVFLSYAATPAFQSFLKEIGKAGVKVTAEENSTAFPPWILEYLDSKIGFRIEMQRLAATNRHILIPEGFAARNAKKALNMAEWFYSKGRSAVIKVNFGESGWGLWVLKTEMYPNAAAMRRTFRSQALLDPVWKETLCVVEEFIEPDEGIAGGSPSAEFFIGNEGTRITYCCGQLLNNGQFFGIEMGKDVLSRRVKGALERIALAVGDRYHELGYRGFCDIDFVAAKNGDLYAVETNPRRTGGTHVYDLARRLFGNSWEREHYFLSHDSFQYGAHVLSTENLFKTLEPLLFPIRWEKRGIVVTSINPSDPVMGYVVIDADRESGKNLQRQLRTLLEAVR